MDRLESVLDQMPQDTPDLSAGPAQRTPDASRRELPPAAQRALAEARARRAQMEQVPDARPKEEGGPSGPDPVRYGDWERKGIACDF